MYALPLARTADPTRLFEHTCVLEYVHANLAPLGAVDRSLGERL